MQTEFDHEEDLHEEAYRDDGPRKRPWWCRTRLRWINALGFAVGFLLIVWVVLFLFGLIGSKSTHVPLPMVFTIVLFAALFSSLVMLFWVLSFAWRGMNLGERKPRLYLFIWSVASLLYFLVQAGVLFKFGKRTLPGPEFASELFWSLCPVGVITFLGLTYVNSDLPDEDDGWDDEDDYDDDGYDHDDHDDHYEDGHGH